MSTGSSRSSASSSSPANSPKSGPAPHQKAGKKSSRRGKGGNQKGNAARKTKAPVDGPRSFNIPKNITFPPDLPVSARRDDIMEALNEHQVVVVAGETGSGKTTQLPKMCLELGLAEHGMIGHTQPRRIAARSVAARIAEELGQDLGETVGYQVRFAAETSKQTALKVMTDGILLAEIQQDPDLRQYSVIIIDEAHERSLNIDFLLGYLKRLIRRRDDLKIIITSATIDPESFAEHFALPGADGEPVPAPIIEVSGRTYPVEIRYRPLDPDEDNSDAGRSPGDDQDAEESDQARDPLDAVGDAVEELSHEPPGDILIFFPGEREINDAADMLTDRVKTIPVLSEAQILPLFGRLSMDEQQKVFRPTGQRRIVLSTNVAETSLTVPGIKYVIDTGTARISRYSQRTKVQRLPIERISQASANQRSGRAGRTSAGICIRLYSETDFDQRPEFTDPEILRTSLASVILSMLSIKVAQTPEDIESFPFIQPPEHQQISDGVNLLTELGALNTGKPTTFTGRDGKKRTRTFPRGTITPVGRKIAQLPVDPRLAAMILAADRYEVALEVMIITAALTIQDPRERPTEQRAQADEKHARFADDQSDFSALLNLWNYVRTKQKELSGTQFRKLCRAEFINFLRIREWQDLVQQLRQLAHEVGVKVKPGPPDPANRYDQIHRSILAGLLSQIGVWQERFNQYLGARNSRFAVFPGSGLFKKKHDYVMAAELVETSRLWAHQVAQVQPEWIEEAAGPIAKHAYSDPYWSRRNGSGMTRERVSVYGVPVAVDRPVRLERIDHETAREMFIQNALVEGDWNTRHYFVARNREALAEIDELEVRLRRRDLKISDEQIFEFYDSRIPERIASQRQFDRWWKKARHETPELLDLDAEALLTVEPDVDPHQFPKVFIHPTSTGDVELALEYAFVPVPLATQLAHAGKQQPAATTDGVTVVIPLALLHEMDPDRFTWLIPGLREELVTALIRGLPKPIRKHLVPAPNTAELVMQRLDEFDPKTDHFLDAIAQILRQEKHQAIDREDWSLDRLSDHLKMTFRVVDSRGAVVGVGEDLAQLQQRLAQANQTALAQSLTQAAQRAGKSAIPTPGQAPSKQKPGQKKDSSKQPRTPGATGAAAQQPAGEQFSPRTGITAWDFGDIPRSVKTQIDTGASLQQVNGYPALRTEASSTVQSPSAELVIMRTEQEQAAVHRGGVITVLHAQLPDPSGYILQHLSTQEKLSFSQSPHGTVDSLVADCTRAAIDSLLPKALPYTQAEYDKLFGSVRAEVIDRAFQVAGLVEKILTRTRSVDRRIRKIRSLALAATATDLRAQLDSLIEPGFVTSIGWDHLQDVPRYLQAMEVRLDRLEAGGALQRDGLNQQIINTLEDQYADLVKKFSPDLPLPTEVAEIRWLLQELRVSFFAQELGTRVSVSEKKVRQKIQAGTQLVS